MVILTDATSRVLALPASHVLLLRAPAGFSNCCLHNQPGQTCAFAAATAETVGWSVEELDLGAGLSLLEAGGFDPFPYCLVDIAPVLEDPLKDVLPVDRGGVTGNVAHQPAAGGVIEHVVDQGVGLAVAVVWVKKSRSVPSIVLHF